MATVIVKKVVEITIAVELTTLGVEAEATPHTQIITIKLINIQIIIEKIPTKMAEATTTRIVIPRMGTISTNIIYMI